METIDRTGFGLKFLLLQIALIAYQQPQPGASLHDTSPPLNGSIGAAITVLPVIAAQVFHFGGGYSLESPFLAR